MTNTAPRSVGACTVQIKRALREAGIAVRAVHTTTQVAEAGQKALVQHSVVWLSADEHEAAVAAIRGIAWVRDAHAVKDLFVSVTGPLAKDS